MPEKTPAVPSAAVGAKAPPYKFLHCIQTSGPIWNIRIGPRGRVLYQSGFSMLSVSHKINHDNFARSRRSDASEVAALLPGRRLCRRLSFYTKNWHLSCLPWFPDVFPAQAGILLSIELQMVCSSDRKSDAITNTCKALRDRGYALRAFRDDKYGPKARICQFSLI